MHDAKKRFVFLLKIPHRSLILINFLVKNDWNNFQKILFVKNTKNYATFRYLFDSIFKDNFIKISL